MVLDHVQLVLGILSGSVVGFALGMFGGGGSILAVPLMVYLVGVPDVHIAVGTAAIAVAVNAAFGLVDHARHGLVKWRCAGLFSSAGIAGAFVGSIAGKAMDGRHLLSLFALLMIVVALLMFRSRRSEGDVGAECNREKAPKVLSFGAATGLLSGFFGIGGGFLIVPGLIASTGMPIINAVGSSLVAVCAFGLTTSLSYASSGFVSVPLAAVFVLGGLGGSQIGCRLSRRWSSLKGVLKTVFAILVGLVAIYMILKGAGVA